jgi:MacB-like periplasmic core domain
MKLNWFRRQDEELDTEIRGHLDEAIRDRIARAKESAAERRLTAPEWTALRERSEIFQPVSAFEPKDFTLTGNGAAEPVKAVQISSELLPMFGVQPQQGRTFALDEFQPGHAFVVLISHRLWQNRFGSDDQIIGRATTLNDQSYIIVGVLPMGGCDGFGNFQCGSRVRSGAGAGCRDDGGKEFSKTSLSRLLRRIIAETTIQAACATSMPKELPEINGFANRGDALR